MTAKIYEFKTPKSHVGQEITTEHISISGCNGCEESKRKTREKVRRIHRDYAKEFTSHYQDILESRGIGMAFEINHILIYFCQILDDICKMTERGGLLMSNQCPTKILEQFGDKVAGDYFLVRYLKSGSSIKQLLIYSKSCYLTWYEEDRIDNIIGAILYENLEQFLSVAPDFIKDLDFDISF